MNDAQIGELIEAASDRLASSSISPPTARKSLQKLVDICPFLLPAELQTLKSKEHLHQKLMVMARRAVLIGLTNPTEPTTGGMVKTLELLGSHAFPTGKAYVDAVTELKSYIRSERVKLPAAAVHLTEFPANASGLPKELHTRAYGPDEEPCGEGGPMTLGASGPVRKSSKLVRGASSSSMGSGSCADLRLFSMVFDQTCKRLTLDRKHWQARHAA